MGTLANSEDPDEKSSTCDQLKYAMGSAILIVSICMGKSIRMQKGNATKPFK